VPGVLNCLGLQALDQDYDGKTTTLTVTIKTKTPRNVWQSLISIASLA